MLFLKFFRDYRELEMAHFNEVQFKLIFVERLRHNECSSKKFAQMAIATIECSSKSHVVIFFLLFKALRDYGVSLPCDQV